MRFSTILFTLLISVLVVGIAVSCDDEEKRELSSSNDTSSIVPTVADTSPDEANNSDPIEKNPNYRMAKDYADSLDIDIEEALYRLETMRLGDGGLGTKLETNESETFAGLWWQHEPEFRLVIAFTENGKATIRKYVMEDSPIADLVELRTFPASLEELTSAHHEVSDLRDALSIPISSGINVFENQVEIYVSYLSELNGILQESGYELPDHVTVIATSEAPMNVTPANVNPDDSICFPQMRLHPVDENSILGQGILTLDGCCLRLSEGDGDPGALILWRQDYFVSNNNGVIEILDASGEVVGRVGEWISWGGGARISETNQYPLIDPLPEQCGGPYVYQGSNMSLVIKEN